MNIASSALKEEARKIIWKLQGYFQFKGGEHSERGIKMLVELERLLELL